MTSVLLIIGVMTYISRSVSISLSGECQILSKAPPFPPGLDGGPLSRDLGNPLLLTDNASPRLGGLDQIHLCLYLLLLLQGGGLVDILRLVSDAAPSLGGLCHVDNGMSLPPLEELPLRHVKVEAAVKVELEFVKDRQCKLFTEEAPQVVHADVHVRYLYGTHLDSHRVRS